MIDLTETPSYDKGNWNRWGKDDERGTLNLITPEVVTKAASLVKKGKTYPLGIAIRHTGYGVPSFPTRVPPIHVATYFKSGEGRGGGDDYVVLNTHNQTHLDSLAHVFIDNKLYNGHGVENLTSAGSEKNSIDKVGCIFTRGLLIDMAGFKGVDHMEKGQVINSEDMTRCANAEGVKFEAGDAVLVRTGALKTYDKKNPIEFFRGTAGLGIDTIDLFDSEGTAVVGADNYSIEVEPSEVGGFATPLHENLLWKRGMQLIELIDLDGLARDKVYEFLFVVAPLRIEKGLGSPINPIAIC